MVDNPEQAAYIIRWRTLEDLTNFQSSPACIEFLRDLPEHTTYSPQAPIESVSELKHLTLGGDFSAPPEPSRFLVLNHATEAATPEAWGLVTLTIFLVPYQVDDKFEMWKDKFKKPFCVFAPRGSEFVTGRRNFRHMSSYIWYWVRGEDHWMEERFGKSEQQVQQDNHEHGTAAEGEKALAADPQAMESWNRAIAKVMPPATAWAQERWDMREVPRVYPPEPDIEDPDLAKGHEITMSCDGSTIGGGGNLSRDVQIGVLTNNLPTSPNIVLDNTKFENVGTTVTAVGGGTLLSGNLDLWATGKRYNGDEGSIQTGAVTEAPERGEGLNNNNGLLYVRTRPQYAGSGTDSFLVATTDGGCKNDATGNQASCINAFLRRAVAGKKIAYFPAGVYAVGSTVNIPTGSIVQGSLWSRILGSGFYFSDMKHPKVMVQVGNKGDVGTMEITDMLFSVRGATAGAILMEWNVAAVFQGAAAMWDSHFRVGGAIGTDLDLTTCPKFSNKAECIAASLLFHVTPQANGYFENVWAWMSDYDNDKSIYNQPDSSSTQISVFAARGMLIESKGPSWFYGGGSEHAILYNYLISGAKSVFMGHIQTESPYYQPNPRPPAPFQAAASFPNDPDFSHCEVAAEVWDNRCNYAWGLQIIDSEDIMIHSAGLYSFFNEYYQDCILTHNCQDRIPEVRGSKGVVIYNLFTVATINIASGIDNTNVPQDGNQRGFTTDISVWVPLPGDDHVDIVWVGTEVWDTPTVSCPGQSCMLVIPTSSLGSSTTIRPKSYTTSLEYGGFKTTTIGGVDTTVFVTTTTTLTISVPSIVTDGMPFSNVNVSTTGAIPITILPSIDIPPVVVTLPNGEGSETTRTVSLPPWPQIEGGPSIVFTDPATLPSSSGAGLPTGTTYFTSIGTLIVVPGATVKTVTFPASTGAITIEYPATTSIVFATPAVVVATTCTDNADLTLNFACPTTRGFTFLGPATALGTVDCSLVTAWTTGSASTTTPLPIFTYWPRYGQIVPEEEERDEPEPDDDGVHVSSKLPPGITIRGKLPDWPRITIGYDHRLTTSSEPDCETRTAEACTTTNYVSDGSTTSSTTLCETVSGCSVSVSDSTTAVIGTQTAAPVGHFGHERWATQTLGADYTNSVYAAIESRLAREEASADATTLSFTSGLSAGPTCGGGASTACGGTVCSGYWCDPRPTGPLPGFKDPKDPSSGGWEASTTTVGQTSGSSTEEPGGTPTTPLLRGPIKCFDEADFPGHADIQSGDQAEFSQLFSSLGGDEDLIGPGDPPITLRQTDRHGVKYDYSCNWVPGCVTELDKQSFGFPLGLSFGYVTAYSMVREDYTKCVNGGVGGSCQVGCLLYTFEGARGGGETDPCEDFNCAGCGGPFETSGCQRCCNNRFVFAAPGNSNASTNRNGTIYDDMNKPVYANRPPPM